MDSAVQAISAGGVRKPVQRAKSAALTFLAIHVIVISHLLGMYPVSFATPEGETGYIPSRRDILRAVKD